MDNSGNSGNGNTSRTTTGGDNGMGINSPSFSSSRADDIEKIKNTVDKSRSEQSNRGKGTPRNEYEDSNDNNKKNSELSKKDDLDSKDESNSEEKEKETEKDKDSNEKNDNASKEDNNKKTSLKDLNPINKVKGKLNVLKIKIYLIIGAVAAGLFILILIVGMFAAIIGSITDFGIDIDSADIDSIDIDSYDLGDSDSSAVNVALQEYEKWQTLDNNGKCEAIKKYLNACGNGYSLNEYCAGFVSYALKESGNFDKLGLISTAVCRVDGFAQSNMTKGVSHDGGGSYVPKPGDLAIYNLDGDYSHIEMVEKVENNTVYLIGGNTGEGRTACGFREVRRKNMPLNNGSISHYVSY